MTVIVVDSSDPRFWKISYLRSFFCRKVGCFLFQCASWFVEKRSKNKSISPTRSKKAEQRDWMRVSFELKLFILSCWINYCFSLVKLFHLASYNDAVLCAAIFTSLNMTPKLISVDVQDFDVSSFRRFFVGLAQSSRVELVGLVDSFSWCFFSLSLILWFLSLCLTHSRWIYLSGWEWVGLCVHACVNVWVCVCLSALDFSVCLLANFTPPLSTYF